MIQNPANLSLSRGQVRLRNDDGEFTLPIEDITALILESPQITLSSIILSACQEQGVAVITCDSSHMPNGVLLPFQPHSRQSRVAHIQISATESLKKRLWQRVVQAKVRNQALCLEQAQGKEAASRLHALSGRIKPGDPQNIEAQAAREYWPRLLGKDFRRGANDSFNAALNYGYAVIRAYIARSQVAYGLIPAFGIHHSNELNAFNLTDDVMEVLRPFVDWKVWSLKEKGVFTGTEETLSKEIRAGLAQLGHENSQIDGQVHTIANVCDKMAASLVSAYEGKNPALLCLPEISERKNRYECG
ncbi:MAG: type II CRISPR-associated endonuclease Cas1 [Rhodospirillales bacterium]|nr:type II CRISPR-associated endonuclease Cas1 [Rhodospirillales bacterium]